MARKWINDACRAGESRARQWKLGPRPAFQLFKACEAKRVLVGKWDLPDGLSGAFMRGKKHEVEVILVSTRSTSVHHQRFTLAHELGHLALHKDKEGYVESLTESDEDKPQLEREADWFAAGLLVPYGGLRGALKKIGVPKGQVDDRMVIELSADFGVSQHVLVRRLAAVGYLNHGDIPRRLEKPDWKALWRRYAPDQAVDNEVRPSLGEWNAEGVSAETRLRVSKFPSDYRNMAFEAYRQGKITAGKLADLLDLPSKRVVLDELAPLLRPESVMDSEWIRRLDSGKESRGK